jgi:hypothetical protein
MTTHSEASIEMFPSNGGKKKRVLTEKQYAEAVERARIAREGRQKAIAKRKNAEAQRRYRAKLLQEKNDRENSLNNVAKMVKAATGNPQKPEAPWMPPPAPPAPEPKVVPSTDALEAKIRSLEHQAAQYRVVIDYLESKLAHTAETLSIINRKRIGAPF